MEQELKQLAELIKEIIPALYREMGGEWCSNMLTRLDKYQKDIDLKVELNHNQP